ncbi:MAG: cobyrinate a,c-diamide synthase [Filifactoraceae bacterium]
MEKNKLPRIMLVGTGSGCGKTTLTCGLLSAFKSKGLSLAAFKCGPDYIDPMFHKEALGINSFNLDVVLTGEEQVKYILGERSKGCDLSIIEGVMGMYDGQKNTDHGSSNHISSITNTPEILVVSPKGVGLSIAATVKGYKEFRENNIKGVILNNINGGMYKYYKDIIEKEVELKVLGYLPSNKELVIESRHLGLVTAGEIKDIKHRLDKLGEICQQTIDLDAIEDIGRETEELIYKKITIEKESETKVKIGLAWDNAFCFYYEDSLKVLEDMGGEIIRFSPLNDSKLPEGISALILPGGYPELYGKDLEENMEMREEIKKKIEEGLPTIAECGGYMYLCESISDLEGREYQMVGIVKHKARMTEKLVRFGYGTMEATKDGLLALKGEKLLVHEFHYSDTDKSGSDFNLVKSRGEQSCGISQNGLYAGYPHLHFLGNLKSAKRFINMAKAWGERWKEEL